MKVFLGLLLTALALPAIANVPEVRVPAGLHEGGVAQAMPALARETMAVYREADRQRYLGTLFRLQLVAGQYPQAIESIDAIRALRNDAASQPPLYLQYEIHARANALQARHGMPFPQAWRQTFVERFGALGDRTALLAEFGFGSSLTRMRSEFDTALAKAAGRQRLPLPEAIDLIRAYQVHAAYAAFQPLFAAALKDDDARRYRIDRDASVRTPDGASLAVFIVRPMKAPPLPTLLQFTIYANDDLFWVTPRRWPRMATWARWPTAGARAAVPMPSHRSSTTAPMRPRSSAGSRPNPGATAGSACSAAATTALLNGPR